MKYAAPIKNNKNDASSEQNDDNKNQSISWNQLVNTRYWSLNLVSVKIDDKSIDISTNIAIVDTGTSYLLMPTGKLFLKI